MLYGPTNEELITEIFRSSIKSYKSLPQLLYHIQWKFRDELRPRFGVMRCREFYMKDAYSFDLNHEEAIHSYNKFFLSYLKTFNKLELSAIPMSADTGPIGGNLSHEFVIIAETGESKIYTDKRIFDLNYDDIDLSKDSLNKLRKNYEQFYSVTDEKFNESDFEKNVKPENKIITKGIEVGHIFYFGDKYSKPMKTSVDYNGKKEFVKMGSYGIGVSRLVGAIIEANYDEKNEIMKWPMCIAPFHCALLPFLNKNDKSKLEETKKIYDYLKSKKIDIIIDDTEDSISSKVKKFNLIGVPFQIIIGKNSDDDYFEFKENNNKTSKKKLDEIVSILIKKIKN